MMNFFNRKTAAGMAGSALSAADGVDNGCDRCRLPQSLILVIVLLFAACAPIPPSGYDYEYERDYKTGRISEHLLARIPPEIKRPAVLVVTSFVQLDDFSRTSRFGLLLAEQLMSRLAGHGLILKETRMQNAFYQGHNGEFVLSREFNRVAHELNARLVLIGTYLEAQENVLLNVRLVDFQQQTVIASFDCQLRMTPDIEVLLQN
jgi:TolB-like protein